MRGERWLRWGAENMLPLSMVLTVATVALWLTASILSHSTRSEFVQQAELAATLLGVAITAVALWAAGYQLLPIACTCTPGCARRMRHPPSGRGGSHARAQNDSPGRGGPTPRRITGTRRPDSPRALLERLARPPKARRGPHDEPPLSPFRLRYVPDVHTGFEPHVEWEAEADGLRIPGPLFLEEGTELALPPLSSKRQTPTQRISSLNDHPAELRMHLELRGDRAERVWQFRFPLAPTDAY